MYIYDRFQCTNFDPKLMIQMHVFPSLLTELPYAHCILQPLLHLQKILFQVLCPRIQNTMPICSPWSIKPT